MKSIIIGSGGSIPTPRPFCQCELCKKARKQGLPYKRNSSSFYIEDSKTLFDCPEDIGDSLNSRDIKQVDNLFITHWHPDHTFGLRPLLESNFNFIEETVGKQIQIYVPKQVWETLKDRYPSIQYLTEIMKVGKVILIEEGDKITLGNIKIKPIGYKGKKSDTYAYLIEENGKQILYSPCDTISFDNYKNFPNLDLWITECGVFTDYDKEISFSDLLQRIDELKPKKTIITHIEEIELKIAGWDKLHEIETENKTLKFAEDGMIIEL